ncbi:MAG: PTS sugar transporter subunit IIC [Candidatus Nanopelagicales bacterium]
MATSWGARARHYLVVTSNGFVVGLFGTLIAGVILTQFGTLLEQDWLVKIGTIAEYMMGPAIGFGIASALHAKPLVTAAAIGAAAIGAGTVLFDPPTSTVRIGEPVSAYVAAVVAIEVGSRVAGRTPIDIVLTPVITLMAGGLAGIRIGPYLADAIGWVGDQINRATELQPLLMGITVAVAIGWVLVSPTSSAALAIAMGLGGLAAGAAMCGGTAQMVGFGFGTLRQNGLNGLFGQSLGTAKLQLPNIIAKPAILIPTTIVSALCGALSTTVFHLESTSVGAGMGSAGLVGQIATLSKMGSAAWPGILVLNLAIPALLTPMLMVACERRGLFRSAHLVLPAQH